MRDLAILFVHLLTTIAKLTRPGGARAVVAESLLVKHQLLILNRARESTGPSTGRPYHCWAVRNHDASFPLAALCHCVEARYDSQFPLSTGET